MKFFKSARNKLINIFSLSVLILNMSFVSVFFVVAPETQALQPSLCEAAVDVVLIMDRSGSMDNGAPSKCEWRNLEWVSSSFQCVFHSEEDLTESECSAMDDGATQCPGYVYTPAVSSKMKNAISAANSFLANMGPEDQSALISYADDATPDKPLSVDHSVTETAVNGLSSMVGGSTNIGDAITLANSELNSGNANPQSAKAIILLTDGKANKPNGNGFDENQDDIDYAESKAEIAANQGFKIFTIGLGNDVNGTMLGNIASITGGDYYFAPTGADLENIYIQITSRICELGSISGYKYIDSDGDGDISGENPASGWSIVLGGDASSTQATDINGYFSFAGLLPGNYTVSEVVSDGYVQTFPVVDKTYNINLGKEDNVTDINFGNFALSTSTGSIVIAKEGGISGLEFDFEFEYPDFSSDVFKLASGTKELKDDLSPGVYHIREKNLPNNGWGEPVIDCGQASTSPDGSYGVYIELQGVENIVCLFTNSYNPPSPELGSISGYKYKDTDNDASTTADWIGLDNWVINLFKDSTSTPIATTTTNSSGYFVFNNLVDGAYRLSEVLKSGWTQLFAPENIEIKDGNDSIDNVFINYEEPEENEETPGCTDQSALNYDPNATEDDGSCRYDTPSNGGGGGGGSTPICILRGDCGEQTPTPTPEPEKPIVLGETGEAILELKKENNRDFANPGNKDIEYVISVENTGSLTAFNVIVKDELPKDLSYADIMEKTREWIVGDLAPGEKKEISYMVNVSEEAESGLLKNTATAKADNHEEISAEADLEIRPIIVLAETGFLIRELFVLLALLLTFGLGSVIASKKAV